MALTVPTSYFINQRIHQISLQFNTYENISANLALESRTLCMMYQSKTYNLPYVSGRCTLHSHRLLQLLLFLPLLIRKHSLLV